MPNRLIREGLMEAEAMLSVPVEARWLFVIIMLSADDLGLFEATVFKLARRADVNRDLAGNLMQMLADADLIRLYEVDGKRYGFIPKYRQRVQIQNTKHPLPPVALYQDDSDALNKINKLASKTSVGAPVGSGWTTDAQPSEAEAEVEAKKRVSGSTNPRPRRKAADRLPNCPYALIADLYHEVLPEWPRARMLGKKREAGMASLWRFVLTSTKSDGSRRATDADQAMAWIRSYFDRARANEFLMGRATNSVPGGPGHENWQPDIDFLMTEKGMKQVIEKTKDAA